VIDAAGTVWITDFGLAHDASYTETLTRTGDFLGTLRYAGPERFSGRAEKRVDIYQLGITLYELRCGRPAYAGAQLNHILHEEPTRPRQVDHSIPRDLETIVLKAMARDPPHRYATAEGLAEDLRWSLEDRRILARRAMVEPAGAGGAGAPPGFDGTVFGGVIDSQSLPFSSPTAPTTITSSSFSGNLAFTGASGAGRLGAAVAAAPSMAPTWRSRAPRPSPPARSPAPSPSAVRVARVATAAAAAPGEPSTAAE
jgi:serine/threonine protein kinase